MIRGKAGNGIALEFGNAVELALGPLNRRKPFRDKHHSFHCTRTMREAVLLSPSTNHVSQSISAKKPELMFIGSGGPTSRLGMHYQPKVKQGNMQLEKGLTCNFRLFLLTKRQTPH